MKNAAEEWALLNGCKIDSWVGDGDFGEAYLTMCGKILKVTSDEEEFVAANRLLGVSSDHLIEVYTTDIYENNLIILMEELDTEGISDLFSEVTSALDEEGFDTIEYLDTDDFELSEEGQKFFTDIQRCIEEYKSSGTIPMDIHENNIGRNSVGNYVLFDQKDKTANLSQDLKEIIEQKEKKRIFDEISAKKVSLSYEIKEIEFIESKFNTSMKNLISSVVDEVSKNYTSLKTKNNEKIFPEIVFPDKVNISIMLTTDNELLSNFDTHNGTDVLGIQALTTGNGLLGETHYMENHVVIIEIDEEKYNRLKKETFMKEADFLRSYLTTVTHELSHVFEFIENGGGLSPREVDNLYESGDIDYDLFACSTGILFLSLNEDGNNGFSYDPDDICDLMEERVELKGIKMLDKLDVYDDMKNFLNIIKDKKPKIKP